MNKIIYALIGGTILVLPFLFNPCSADGSTSSEAPEGQKLWNYTWTDRLKKDLFTNYDKFAKPSMNLTKLSLKLVVRHLDLDELTGVMTVSGWLNMHWNDEKLKWNASQYGGLTIIHVGNHEVWEPDLALYNSAEGVDMAHFGNSHRLVYNTGHVLWVPPSKFQVFCQLDLRLWPFDEQTCSLIFGSWTHGGDQIDIEYSDKDAATTDMLVENGEWEIDNITTSRHTKYYPCCEEPYIDITYNVTVRRRAPTYKAIVITPATCIILMTLSSFWLPPQSGEKILLNGINIIVISIFMMFFARQLPVMAFHTPLVVLFYSSSLYLITISMIMSVIVLYISKTRQSRQLPWFIKRPLEGWLGKILFLPNLNYEKNSGPQRGEELRDQHFEDHNTAEDDHIINSAPKKSMHQDWIMFAMAIDRVFFVFYCLIFIILAAMYSV